MADINQVTHYRTIIIGAGPAGIATSYYLDRHRVSHILLERKEPFASWHRRWQGFSMNTVNWMNGLPGGCNHTLLDQKGRASREQILEYFQSCQDRQQPPVRYPFEVTRVDITPQNQWELTGSGGTYYCDNVVIATGNASRAKYPDLQRDLPAHIPQLHVQDFRTPRQLRSGNILVVGTGSSGVQVTEILLRSGRFDKVYLSCSNNFSFPWRLLGIPIHRWVHKLGFFDLSVDSWLGRRIIRRARGRGDPATPPTPKWLGRHLGAKLLPRVTGIEDDAIRCAGHRVPTRDLTVMWCTGFEPDYSILAPALAASVLGCDGVPRHHKGVVPTHPGLYFMGLRFQATLSSHILYGMGRDADYIARHIAERIT